MIVLVALFVHLILLKNIYASCTYSIGLGDMFNDGWMGSYLSVNVGGSSIQFTRVRTQPNPVWYNFQVQKDDLVTVDYTFNSGISPAWVFYTVMDAPNGGGNVVYQYMPVISTIPNLCLDECDYSIKLYAGTDANMWRFDNYGTVYLNGIPIIPRLIIENQQQTQIYNFPTKVRSTDVITVQRPGFMYQSMGFEVYFGADASGGLVYELFNHNSGPPASQPIKNYCGLNANLDVFIPLSQSPPGSVISVAVFKYIPSQTFSVKLFMVCGSKVKAVIREVLTSSNFQIPDDCAGFSYFYAMTLDYNINKFLNSPNVLFYVGKLITPISGDISFIPPPQQPRVAQLLSIPGERFDDS